MAPSKKRKLTIPSEATMTTTINPQQPEYTKSNTIYFDDGNIILIAEQTAFRVHKGLLSYNSDVFRNMFATVQEPPGLETFDGLPIVKLSGDSGTDMEYFLKALYQFPNAAEKFEPKVWFGIFRVASKHLFERLRLLCYDTISRFSPTTLRQFDVFQPAEDALPRTIILLARETGETRFLPAAFYMLSLFDDEKEPEKEPMSPYDKLLYFEGKQQLATIWSEFVRDEWGARSECNFPKCAEAWKELAEGVQ
ncbi:hypothetical protein K439DRAFT_1619981 [Ramaria rubella]|nr:hypothetical protein K439DRAFT_1619981 [Ramaria rubella]